MQTISDELAQKRIEVINYIHSLGFQTNFTSKCSELTSSCYADFYHNYVINYDGNIFRCTARDFSRHSAIGRMSQEGVIEPFGNQIRTVRDNLTEECLGCLLLPICNICFQNRRESRKQCPSPRSKQFAQQNIEEYFYAIKDTEE